MGEEFRNMLFMRYEEKLHKLDDLIDQYSNLQSKVISALSMHSHSITMDMENLDKLLDYYYDIGVNIKKLTKLRETVVSRIQTLNCR